MFIKIVVIGFLVTFIGAIVCAIIGSFLWKDDDEEEEA